MSEKLSELLKLPVAPVDELVGNMSRSRVEHAAYPKLHRRTVTVGKNPRCLSGFICVLVIIFRAVN